MKQRLIILVAFLMAVSSTSLQAQKWMDMWKNPGNHTFFEIQAEFNKYFETHEPARGTGYKQFKRWEYFMEPRVGPEGKIMNPNAMTWKNYQEYLKEHGYSAARTTSLNGNWVFFGATNHFKGTSGYNGGIGRINVIRFHPTDPNTIYVGAPAGGLFRTTNNGATWTPLTDGLAFWGVSGIAIEPADPDHIYILTGDGDGGSSRSAGVWESFDAGATWSVTGLSINYVTSTTDGYKLMMDPSNSNILYAVMTNGLQKTTDAGATWTNVNAGSYRDMEFQPGNSSVIYLTGGNTIQKSVNAGATWTTVHTIAGASRIALGVTPANANYVYALGGGVPASGQYAGVYRSVDAGATWSLRSNTPNILGYDINGNDASGQVTYDLAIAVDPSDANIIHTAGINAWKSVNGGTTMTNTSYWVEGTVGAGYTHADIHEMVFNGSTLYCGSDGGIYRSTNSAVTWTDMSAGLGITEFYRFGGTPQNSTLYVGGAQDNGSNKLEGPLPDLSMEHIYGADGMEAAVDPTNVNTIYYTTQSGGLRRSDNGGNTGVGISGSGVLGGGGWVTPFVLNPQRPNSVLAGYTNVGVNYNRGSAAWVNLSNGNIGGGVCNMVAYAPTDTNTIYVVKSSAVYRTVNHGATWTNITAGLGAGSYTYIAVSPTNSQHIFVTISNWTANQKIYESVNGGTTWTNFSGAALPNVPVNCVVYETGSSDGVYIGTDAGVYYRDDMQLDWVNFSTGLPFCRVMELEINYTSDQLRAATYGRSIWESDLYGEACPVNLNLVGNITGTQTLEASNNITSVQTLVLPANIVYQAGNSITLNAGFTVPVGAVFSALIAPCSARMAEPISGVFVPTDETGKPESNPTAVPDGYAFGVFPNPLRSWGWVNLELPEAAAVKVEVYNASMQKVATVMTGNKEAGNHTVQFDASQLPAGIYFFRAEAGKLNQLLKVAVAH